MPELPDVEVFKRYVDSTSLHQTIDTVHVSAEKTLKEVSASTLRRHLKDRELTSTRRHGKHLFLEIEGDDRWLRLHFGMTGRLAYYEDGDDAPPHARLVLDFRNGGHLAYDNQRRFGEIGLVEDPESYVEAEDLGPDPLAGSVDLARFRERLEGRSGTIKGTLMNQQVLAGLGNVYTDEVLFQAGVHPKAATNALSEDRVKAIHRALEHVLTRAIEAGAQREEMPDTWLLPQRGEEGPCPRCDGRLRETKVSGRTTWYCDRHQEGG